MRLLIFTLSVGFFIWLPSAVADSRGGLSVDSPAHLRQVQNSDNPLLTLTVKNIQVHADWHVTSDGDVFTISNDGVLRRKVLATGRHVAKIYAVDRFDRLNSNYANLTASAVITVDFVLGTEFYFADAPSQLFALARLPEAVTLYQFTATNGVGQYTYNLVEDESGYFDLGAASGVLSLPQNDQMRAGTYNLTVAVSDSESNQATAVVRVRIVPNLFFVMGGYDGTNQLNDVWSSFDNKTWKREIANAAWSARQHYQAVVYKGRLYVLGGYDGSNRLNDVWSSADGVNWSSEGNADWSVRSEHQAVVYKGRLYVLGGGTGSGGGDIDSRYNDVWSSADGKSWSFEGTADWTARSGHQAAVHNDVLYVLGGQPSFLDDEVWSSVDGQNWSYEGDGNWSVRRWFQAQSFNSRLYVLGGDAGGALSDIWSSDDGSSLGGKSWMRLRASGSGDGWSNRSRHQVLLYQGLMYVMGGGYGGSELNDVWSSGDGKNWTKVTDADWSARDSHQAVVFPAP